MDRFMKGLNDESKSMKMEGWMVGWKDGWMEGCGRVDGSIHRWIDIRMDE